jgi:hypothetical protein
MEIQKKNYSGMLERAQNVKKGFFAKLFYNKVRASYLTQLIDAGETRDTSLMWISERDYQKLMVMASYGLVGSHG